MFIANLKQFFNEIIRKKGKTHIKECINKINNIHI